MNTFEKYIGRKITKVLRVEGREGYPLMGEWIAIFLMLEEASGLVIAFNSYYHTTTLEYMTHEIFKAEYDTECGETFVIEIESSNRLSCLPGQTLESIQVAQSDEEIIVGDNFIVKDGKYGGVIIKTAKEKLALLATIDGGQVLFDTEEIPGKQRGWTLQ